MRATLFALAIALVAAGCVKPTAPPADHANETQAAMGMGPAPAAPPATGSLLVTAVFSDKTPLEGVNVTIADADASRVTDASGVARFDALPAGTHTLVAVKAAHRTAQQQVNISAGAQTAATVVMEAADGGQHSHTVGFAAHRDLYSFEGHFDCSAEYVIITGDCLILFQNVSEQTGTPDLVSNTTHEKNVIDFPLDINWSGLVVEMSWNDTALPLSDGMTLALEPSEAPVDGHAAKYAQVDGDAKPLRIQLAPGVQDRTATAKDMPNPNGGEVIRARAFVRGYQHDAGGAGFLGVGAAPQGFDFKLYVSIFYGQPVPDGYSAVAR